MPLYEIGLLVLAVLSVGAYLSSGLRFEWGFYAVVVAWVAGAAANMMGLTWNDTVVFRSLAPVVGLGGVFLDLLVFEKEERPENRYFDLLGLPLMVGAIFYLLLGFTKGDWANGMWALPLVVVYLSTWLCRRARRSHGPVFLVTGIVTIVVAVACFLAHPILAGAELTLHNLFTSMKINAPLLVVCGLFFFGNYAKMGLFESPALHKKLFAIAASLFAIAAFARDPQLRHLVEKVPYGDWLPSGISSAAFAFPPLAGLFANRHTRVK